MKKEPKFEAEITWESPYWRVRVYTLPRGAAGYGYESVEHSGTYDTRFGAILAAKRMIRAAYRRGRGKEGLTIRG